MTKPTFSLDLVQVASPCHVPWEEMTCDESFGTERRRFCRHCKLHVYNLSDMPRDEAERFVNEAEGRACIRLFRRDDGTIITRDCPVGLRALRQRLVRAVAALAGLLMALVSGTLFAGRLKNLQIKVIGQPTRAYAEWIEPGSTTTWSCTVGVMLPVQQPSPPLPAADDPQFQAPESSLPEPTPEQMQEMYDRLRGE
jgi:hypothetical protein